MALLAGAAQAANHTLPDPRLTPGATDPRVTQANIGTTICVRSYTKTIRPPARYTGALKRRQLAEWRYVDRNLRDFEEDHLISLELGGSPTSMRNLWPEPWAGALGARAKDRLENELHWRVCSGQMLLRDAQRAIATNWIAAYRQYAGQ